jgi:threonine dehydrogenase-like Zn-dependent dehydrogenase
LEVSACRSSSAIAGFHDDHRRRRLTPESYARGGRDRVLIVGDDTVAKIQELTGGLGVDHSFEVVGTAATIKLRGRWPAAAATSIVGVAAATRRSRSRRSSCGITRTIRPSLRLVGSRARRPADRGPHPQRGVQPTA